MTDSLDPEVKSLYTQQFEAAVALFDAGDYNSAIKKAKDNLNDLTVPAYHTIQNCILIVSASDDEGDRDVGQPLFYSSKTLLTQIISSTAVP
jgi:hypothetical protein